MPRLYVELRIHNDNERRIVSQAVADITPAEAHRIAALQNQNPAALYLDQIKSAIAPPPEPDTMEE